MRMRLLRAATGGSNSGRDLPGYVPKSVWDHFVEGIDHFPKNCQSLNYNDGVPISVSGGRHHLPA